MTRVILASILALVTFRPPLPACSCAADLKAFCARDLNAIDSEQTVVFVGRATKAVGGMRDFQAQMRLLAPNQVPLPFFPGLQTGSPEASRSTIDATKEMYLQQYGSRLDDTQRAQVESAKSEQDLTELVVLISFLGRPVEFEVVENLIGDLPQSIEIFTGRGGGDCGFDFLEGETYLIEASRRPNGELHTWMCQSRVTSIAFATEDLRTLRAWKEGKPVAPRVYGVASDWTQRQDDYSSGHPPAAGVRLALSDRHQTARIAADQDGQFRFENLGRAAYDLQIEEPGWRLTRFSDGHKPIDLTAVGCAELFVSIAQEQGTIAGRVLPYPGEYLPDHLWIEAISQDPEGADPFDATAKPPDGNFEIDEIEPGDYYVAINVNNTPSGPHHPSAKSGRVWPYGPTYYPGVTDRSRAAVFHVERGQTISIEDWTLPPRLRERRVAGVAILPNGTLAGDVRLTLRRPGLSEVAEQSGPTGDDGEFVVWPLESLDYMLQAASYDSKSEVVYRGEMEISGDEEGPLVLQLEVTDEKPTDQQFFSEYTWRKD